MILRLILILLMTYFQYGCVVPGDAAFMVKGMLLNSSAEAYVSCSMVGSQGNEIVYSTHISGIFERTIIFNPVSSKSLVLELSCVGTTETHKYVIERIPRPFGTVLDLGTITLKSEI